MLCIFVDVYFCDDAAFYLSFFLFLSAFHLRHGTVNIMRASVCVSVVVWCMHGDNILYYFFFILLVL